MGIFRCIIVEGAFIRLLLLLEALVLLIALNCLTIKHKPYNGVNMCCVLICFVLCIVFSIFFTLLSSTRPPRPSVTATPYVVS